jgi:hypothetical protein
VVSRRKRLRRSVDLGSRCGKRRRFIDIPSVLPRRLVYPPREPVKTDGSTTTGPERRPLVEGPVEDVIRACRIVGIDGVAETALRATGRDA